MAHTCKESILTPEPSLQPGFMTFRCLHVTREYPLSEISLLTRKKLTPSRLQSQGGNCLALLASCLLKNSMRINMMRWFQTHWRLESLVTKYLDTCDCSCHGAQARPRRCILQTFPVRTLSGSYILVTIQNRIQANDDVKRVMKAEKIYLLRKVSDSWWHVLMKQN